MNRLKYLTRVSALLLFAVAAVPAWAASPQLLKPDELFALLDKAETPADHLKLAEHYSADAEKLEKDASRHQDMAARYRRTKVPDKLGPSRRGLVKHCERLALSLRNGAKAAEQLAKIHKEMADELGK